MKTYVDNDLGVWDGVDKLYKLTIPDPWGGWVSKTAPVKYKKYITMYKNKLPPLVSYFKIGSMNQAVGATSTFIAWTTIVRLILRHWCFVYQKLKHFRFVCY